MVFVEEAELGAGDVAVDSLFLELEREVRLLDLFEADGRFGFSSGGLKISEGSLREIFDPELPTSNGLFPVLIPLFGGASCVLAEGFPLRSFGPSDFCFFESCSGSGSSNIRRLSFFLNFV